MCLNFFFIRLKYFTSIPFLFFSMVANFSTTWSDDYVILSDLLFIIYVDMSDHYVGMSEKKHHN